MALPETIAPTGLKTHKSTMFPHKSTTILGCRGRNEVTKVVRKEMGVTPCPVTSVLSA